MNTNTQLLFQSISITCIENVHAKLKVLFKNTTWCAVKPMYILIYFQQWTVFFKIQNSLLLLDTCSPYLQFTLITLVISN